MRMVVFVVCLFTCYQAISAQTEPTGWRGPVRDGIYPEKGLLASWPDGGPKLLWQYDKLGTGYASAAVTGEKVYTAGTADSLTYILCFDAGNGKVIWSRDLLTECQGTNRTWGFADNLIVDGDKLKCTPSGAENNIVALNRKTGATLWESNGYGVEVAWHNPDIWSVLGEAVVVGDRIYSAGKNSNLFCVDWKTGKTLFTHPFKNDITVLIAADNLIFSYDLFGNCALYKPLENRFETAGSFTLTVGSKEHCAHPVIKDGRLYIRHDKSLLVYNLKSIS